MPQKRQPQARRGVIDTSVLVAGVSGFKPDVQITSPSAQLIRTWIEEGHFTWLISGDIIAEYKAVLTRLRVRPQLIGRIINLLREEAEEIEVPTILNAGFGQRSSRQNNRFLHGGAEGDRNEP